VPGDVRLQSESAVCMSIILWMRKSEVRDSLEHREQAHSKPQISLRFSWRMERGWRILMSGISQRWELRDENFGGGNIQVMVISSPGRIVRDA
jgi:hypothetical protein